MTVIDKHYNTEDIKNTSLNNNLNNNNHNFITIKKKYNYNKFMSLFHDEYSGNIHPDSNVIKQNDLFYKYQEAYILIGLVSPSYCADVKYYRDLPYIHHVYSNYDDFEKSYNELYNHLDCVFLFKEGKNITSLFTKHNILPSGSTIVKYNNTAHKCFNPLFRRDKKTKELYVTVEEYIK